MEQNNANDISVLLRLREALAQEFDRRVQIPDPDDVNPDTLALRDAIHNFACPITYVVATYDKPISFWGGDCDRVTYTRFDMERLKTAEVRCLGEFRHDDFVRRTDLLQELLDKEPAPDLMRLIQSSTFLGASEPGKWFLRVLPNDLRQDARRAALDVLDELSWHCVDRLVRAFDRKPNFKEIYSFSSPHRRSAEDVLRGRGGIEGVAANAVDPREFKALEERAAETDALQVIPKVPEGLAQTVQMAKELYVFATFRYDFATICNHYCYLAIEAALKLRWCSGLHKPARIDAPKGWGVSLDRPSHHEIERLAREHGRVSVNGTEFKRGMKWLIDELVRTRVVTKWVGRLLTSAVHLRNSFSHREFGVIMPASLETLERTTWLINMLFHTA